jgi:integrase
MLLTGCRPGEVFGSKFTLGIRVGDVDLEGGRVTLADTKNRSTHVVMLSRQALQIVAAHCKDKKATDKVFDVVDPGRMLDAINVAAGVTTVRITAHKLRHSFASIAEQLVSAYVLKKMMNHANAGDITAHYVGTGEARLRAGWQAVADFIAPKVA